MNGFKATVRVPDGDSCTGCYFIGLKESTWWCQLFDVGVIIDIPQEGPCSAKKCKRCLLQCSTGLSVEAV